MNEISKVISSAIALNNKTQKEVAKDLNVSVSTISTYCRGTRQPDISMLIKLQKYLNIPVNAIFSEDIDYSIFALSEYEQELLGSIKALNEDNRRLFSNYTKDLLLLLHSTEKKSDN